MCATCGCSTHEHDQVLAAHEPHEHVLPDGSRYVHRHAPAGERHDHGGEPHDHGKGSLVELETEILAKNDALAARNRRWLSERGILALNLMGSPGAGKTALLERTIRTFRPIREARAVGALAVIEGDQATARDADRIRAAGAPVTQLNTGTGCHLDADMVMRGLVELRPAAGGVVVIENVGNLVCPALFDVGEHRRIVVLSVTEGDDKPLKYPHMFRAADLVLLNKIDLLPYVDFDVARAEDHARSANPDVRLLRVSARTDEGLDGWCEWLRQEIAHLATGARGRPLTA
jgi:hydrogenase nickel incorporation protein HypB